MLSNCLSDVDDDIDVTADDSRTTTKVLFLGCGYAILALLSVVVAIIIGYLFFANKMLMDEILSLREEEELQSTEELTCVKTLAYHFEETILFDNDWYDIYWSKESKWKEYLDALDKRSILQYFGLNSRFEILKTHFVNMKSKNINLIMISRRDKEAVEVLLAREEFAGTFEEIEVWQQEPPYMITLVVLLMQAYKLKENQQVLFIHNNETDSIDHNSESDLIDNNSESDSSDTDSEHDSIGLDSKPGSIDTDNEPDSIDTDNEPDSIDTDNEPDSIDYSLCETYEVDGEQGLSEIDLQKIEDIVENKGCRAE